MNVWIYGGCLLDKILNIKSKDYDLIIECKNQKEIQIMKNIIEKKYKFTKNSFGGYKINCNNNIIDIDLICDLRKNLNKFIELNSDGFFYNTNNPNKSIFTKDFEKYINYEKVYVINKNSIHPTKINRRNERIKNAIMKIKKLKKIYKYYNADNK